MNNLFFCSLSSGSSGNSYYLGNKSSGILIDAGISATATRKFLNEIDVPINAVRGILITHNHGDHIRGLEVLTRKNFLPGFTTETIWKSITSRTRNIGNDCIRKISLQEKFELGDFEIEAFPVNHDAPETVGFQITSGEILTTIATDLGHIDGIAESYIKSANLLIIESNYDEEMLSNGNYPYFLKTRISSNTGHLSNNQTANFLAENLSDNTKNICLAHLSKNNNTPERAMQAIEQAFSKKGASLNGNQQIMVLDRFKPSGIINLQ